MGGRMNPEDALLYRSETVFDDGIARETPRYRRGNLLASDIIDGPAVITQHNSTTIVPPGYKSVVLDYGDIRISKV